MRFRYFEDKINSADPTAPVGTSNNPSMKIFTIANVITFCRIALAITFFCLFVNGFNRIACFVLYGVAASTDFLDGQVARRTNTVSWLGKLLDPAVDRLLLFCGVVALVWVGDLPLWVAILVIGRDIYLAFGMTLLFGVRKRPLDVLFIGKVTTALLLFGFTLCLLDWPYVSGLGLVDVGWLPVLNAEGGSLGLLFVYAGCVTSIITAVMYTIEGLQLKEDRDRGLLADEPSDFGDKKGAEAKRARGKAQ